MYLIVSTLEGERPRMMRATVNRAVNSPSNTRPSPKAAHFNVSTLPNTITSAAASNLSAETAAGKPAAAIIMSAATDFMPTCCSDLNAIRLWQCLILLERLSDKLYGNNTGSGTGSDFSAPLSSSFRDIFFSWSQPKSALNRLSKPSPIQRIEIPPWSVV